LENRRGIVIYITDDGYIGHDQFGKLTQVDVLAVAHYLEQVQFNRLFQSGVTTLETLKEILSIFGDTKMIEESEKENGRRSNSGSPDVSGIHVDLQEVAASDPETDD